MDQLKLDCLGEVKPDFDLKTKFIQYGDLVISPDLVLKLYNLPSSPWHSLENSDLNLLDNFLEEEIKHGRIESEIGLGFAICSTGYLNVARWMKQDPIVLRNQVYQGDYFPPRNLIDISKDGSFCLFELGIVAHERTAWMKYLTSKRTESDKKAYLSDFITGWL